MTTLATTNRALQQLVVKINAWMDTRSIWEFKRRGFYNFFPSLGHAHVYLPAAFLKLQVKMREIIKKKSLVGIQ